MTTQELWWLALGLGAVVVVVVAVLLGMVIAAARSIDRHAHQVWIEGKKIAGNTVSIWLLEQVDGRLESLVEAAEALRRSTDSLGEAVRAAVPGKGAR